MIRKNKKNPYIDKKIIKELDDVILSGDPAVLSDVLTYYKQGYKCNDCDNLYYNCECEKCNDCGWNRCLCELGFTEKDYIGALFNNRNQLLVYKKKIKQLAEKFKNKLLNSVLNE